jgi:hypothetical protein
MKSENNKNNKFITINDVIGLMITVIGFIFLILYINNQNSSVLSSFGIGQLIGIAIVPFAGGVIAYFGAKEKHKNQKLLRFGIVFAILALIIYVTVK